MARIPRGATTSAATTSEAPTTASRENPESEAPAATAAKRGPAPAKDPFDEFVGSAPPRLSDDFEKIVERVFDVDVLPTYERLERELVIGEDRSDYNTLRKHLDRAEDNARLAHKLYISARVEQEKYDLDMKPIRAAMMEAANRELQREKADGQRSKAISKDDLEGYCVRHYADEWRTQELKSIKLRKTTEHMEQLASIWKGRCSRVETLLTTLRK